MTIVDVNAITSPNWSQYYATAHAFMFVLDSGDVSSFAETKVLYDDLVVHPRVLGKPILVSVILSPARPAAFSSSFLLPLM